MIDFKNGQYIKLKKANIGSEVNQLSKLFVPNEQIISTYKGMRDYVVFTNKRIISVNIQGVTGKKKDYTSLPYAKIQLFSIETSGVFDMDSELELYFSGVGKIKFEFTGASDITAIGQCISSFVL